MVSLIEYISELVYLHYNIDKKTMSCTVSPEKADAS